MKQVKISDYEQLKLICWQLRDDAIIDEDMALATYERNWAFVASVDFTQKEADFLDYLVRTYGNGVLNV